MSLPTIHPASPLLIKPEPLTPAAFAPFGTVITAPLSPTVTSYPSAIPIARYPVYQPRPVSANQSTALKTSPISPLVNNYPGGDGDVIKGGTGLMSIFSSFPRRNVYISGSGSGSGSDGSTSNPTPTPRLKLGILERHPYTTQTFCPFSYSTVHQSSSNSHHSNNQPSSTSKTYILIIVAPTLPTTNQSTTPTNPPDLPRLRAFIHELNSSSPDSNTPNVAVTYNAGTWHAPMIVLGPRRVDFLVTQFANGVALDDCQEVLVGGGPDGAVLSGRVRRVRERARAREGGKGDVNVEVEVDLGGWGVEVEEAVDGDGDGDGEEKGEESVKWTTDEMIYRAVRASKL